MSTAGVDGKGIGSQGLAPIIIIISCYLCYLFCIACVVCIGCLFCCTCRLIYFLKT